MLHARILFARHHTKNEVEMQKTSDLAAFIEEILNGKIHFLCSARFCLPSLCGIFWIFFLLDFFFFLPEALQTKKNLERGKEQENSNNCGSHSKFIVADINKFINSLYNY